MKDTTKFYLQFQDDTVLVQVPRVLLCDYYQFRDGSGHVIYIFADSYQSALDYYFEFYTEYNLNNVRRMAGFPKDNSMLYIPFNLVGSIHSKYLGIFVPFYCSLRKSIQLYFNNKHYKTCFVENLES